MARNDNYDNDSEGESGKGGKSGQVEFRDFMGGDRLRDDQLSPEERKRLLSVHQDGHENRVKKQKAVRDERKALKEGKISLEAFRQGQQSGKDSGYLPNPALADKAQFSGIDPSVNPAPDQNNAETNNEKRQELHYQYRLENRPDYVPAPAFNPKPTPR